MASFTEKISKAFEDLSQYKQYCQIDDYFLMGSPIKITGILLAYLVFVKWLGPRLMKNRKPFQINNILIVYNIIQILLNGGLATYATYQFVSKGYSLLCIPLLPRNHPQSLVENQLMYTYYMIKIVDLLDTVFFVLRKKYNQASFLHVYHHMAIASFSYIFTRYLPGGHVTLLGLLNTYVHIVMYFYYFLTAFKPELKTSLWWKKHITHLQLGQFFLLLINFGHPLFFDTCDYPTFGLIIPFTQCAIMIVLFGNFYYQTYIREKSKKAVD